MHYMPKLIQKKIIFPFFKQFEGQLPLPSSILDKYYVEYRTNPKHKLMIYYTCKQDNSEWKQEVMNDVGYGIFVKELILFYGEHLEFYITEETREGIQTVESKQLCFQETKEPLVKTKYAIINEILMAKETKDTKQFFDLLEQYCKEEYAVERHFTPV